MMLTMYNISIHRQSVSFISLHSKEYKKGMRLRFDYVENIEQTYEDNLGHESQ